MKRLLWLVLLLAGSAQAAITGPTTNTTGTFTLTASTGEVASGSTNYGFGASVVTFTNVLSGTYSYIDRACNPVYIDYGYPYGEQYAGDECWAYGAEHFVTVTRDTEPTIATSVEAGAMPYSASVSQRGSAEIRIPIRLVCPA